MTENTDAKNAVPPTQEWGPELVNALAGLQDLLQAHVAGKRKETTWLTLRRAFIASTVLVAVLAYALFYARALGFQSDPIFKSIAVVPIAGAIAPEGSASADNVVAIIDRACKAPHVESLLLDINSPGGAPSESERIIAAVEACKKGTQDHPPKKVYALINGLGASAAYMIAMHSNEIYAGRYSLVGSIGAIIRLNDLSSLAKRIGIQEHAYRSAPLKGGPSLIAGPTADDDRMAQGLVEQMGKQFLAEVQAQRGAVLKVTAEELFSGKVWTASDAVGMGLIDGLAVIEELQATKFKGMPMHRYQTKPSLAESMGLKTLATDMLAEMRATQIN